jgi:phosphatidylglycerophosphatase C
VTPPLTVAAFDFDGTLSSRDNFMRFLRLVAGTGETARAVLAAAPALIASRRDPAQRDVAKAIVLRETMRGRRADYVCDLGARFARQIVSEHLHPRVVARLEAHRAAGHHVVLVSASLTCYLTPVAEHLAVPTVLATELEVGPDGRYTGELMGENVRGAEKAARLDAWLAGRPAVVYAYGDSHGDADLLARADHGFLVDKHGRLPESARSPLSPSR